MISDKLSPTQARIAPLIVEGMKNQEIADALGLSQRSIINHCSIMFSKMQCRNRTALAVALDRAAR